ncbi:MAG: hypothetical protein J6W28_04130 [Clostridia bacterium]|nr:hypothetical protein [Clostridia bacterium]
MFLLEGMLGPVLLAASAGAFAVLLAVALLYTLLRSQGKILIRAKRARVKPNVKKAPKTAAKEETLSEEELVAILSAAVYACGETEKKRFRVVSFRRMK